MTRTTLLLVVSFTVLALLPGCGDDVPSSEPIPAPPPMPAEDDPVTKGDGAAPVDREWWDRKPMVRLLLTGGQTGKLKPCGCSSPQLGGLKRAASVLHQLRAKADSRGTIVGALSVGWSMKGNNEAQEEAKADFLRAIHETLGYSATLLGTTDVLVPAMCQPRGETGADVPRPPLNVRLAGTNPASDTPPIADFTVGRVAVRAFSLMAPGQAEMLTEAGFVDGVMSLAGALEGLRPQPDSLWVVGTRLEDKAMRTALLAALPRLGGAVIVDVQPSGLGVRTADRVPLGPGLAPLVVELDELGKSVGVLDLDPAPQGKGWIASYRRIDLVPEWEKFGGEPLLEVEDLNGVYRDMVKSRGYLVDFLRHEDEGAHYTGSSACAECHTAIYNDWKRTPHAIALETLANTDYHWDPECIRCHVVGWERDPGGQSWTVWKSAFRTPDKTAFLGGVGCENCHGPGSLHAADPARVKAMPRRPDKPTCVRCHDPENSHGFNEGYETEYLPLIDHRLVPSDLKTTWKPK